jgi:ribonuclease HII
MLICGVDEAGRGCALGSLVVSAVVFDPKVLKKLPVADSKKLSKKKRTLLEAEINEQAHEVVVVELTAEDINGYHRQGLTLNEMEVIAFTHALNDLETVPDEIYLDAADVLEARFRDNIMKGYHHKEVPIVAEHKADQNRPVVAAASIVAKVTRDAIMEQIAPVSGYGDPKTQEWITDYYLENGEFPPDSRYFWKTFDNIKAKLRRQGIVPGCDEDD